MLAANARRQMPHVAEPQSKAERARRMLADVEAHIGSVKIPCGLCGETIGYYRPARVERPSMERPAVRLKCLRSGCRYETLTTLDEVIAS